jgi:uncharacterized phage infection (PIP) family protein YhgE
MADENIDSKIEFMLEQQAQSAARIQQIEEIILQLAQGTRDRFQATDKRLDDVNEATDKRLDDVDVKIAALIDSQIRTEESVKETAEALRNLIAVVDRYFERRNGNPQS